MKCKKCKQLIHEMVDGELNSEQKKAVLDHLRGCRECSAYHKDIVTMCRGLRETDKQPPEGFQMQWKKRLAEEVRKTPAAPKKRKRVRPGVLIPAVACCAAAVFVVSTALVNPQALGLSGENLTSQWFDIDRPPSPEPKDQTAAAGAGPGIDVQFFGKKEKKENLLDFESSDYSETITSASAEPELSFSGEIISEETPEPSPEPRVASRPADSEAYVWNESAYEITVNDVSSLDDLITRAHETDGIILTEWDVAFILDGPPETVRELMEEFHVSVPEGTKMVRILKTQ